MSASNHLEIVEGAQAIVPFDASTLVPAVVFAEGGVDKILASIRVNVHQIDFADISTPQKRADIKSLAYKIARSKTALDSAGKQLGEDWRKRVDGINADRRRIRDELDALADEVRAPLTAWENAEKARVDGHEAALAWLFTLPHFDGEPAIDVIHQRLTVARNFWSGRDWQEFAKRAHDTKIAVSADLTAALSHWTWVYADRAEAERLRQEEAARVQREREAAIAARAAEEAKREAEAKAAKEAAAAEERTRRQRQAAEEKARQEREAIEARVMAEREETGRQARQAEERALRHAEAAEQRRLAEVRAREEAEERARQAEAQRVAEAKAAETAALQAILKAALDKEAAVEAERARVAAEAEAERQATAAREADRKHKAKIHREARDAIDKILKDSDVLVILGGEAALDGAGEAIVSAIARGLVPHIKVVY